MSAPWSVRFYTEPPRGLAAPILGALALGFGGALAIRRTAYATGLVRRVRVDCPVLSVGNLTAGGNGKTPIVAWLVAAILARGFRPAVLTRGYGRKIAGRLPARIDPAMPATLAGDEPLWLVRKTGVPVIVGPDRVDSARAAIADGAQVLLLDDGFQHWRLARDLDLVLIDAERPFGNGKLLPAGPLREPPSALSRAGLLMLHHGTVVPSAWQGEATGDPFLQPHLHIGVRPSGAAPLGEPIRSVAALAGSRVGLLAAIARPARFMRTVEATGAQIVAAQFLSDHAPFSATALATAGRAARRAGADRVLITEKDAVRLDPDAHAGGLPIWTLAIEPVILAGAPVLEAALDGLLGRVRP